MSNAKPLVFCRRSILAYQAHAKTQTRRLVKPQPEEGETLFFSEFGDWQIRRRTYPGVYVLPREVRQPYAPDDLLWIREALVRYYAATPLVIYAADRIACPDPSHCIDEVAAPQATWTWKRDKLPAMFMPKWACRYYARVVSVTPEALQEIVDEEAVAEGVLVGQDFPPVTTWYRGKSVDLYRAWWNELHSKPGTRFEDNPVVWVYGLEEADASTD